MDFIFLKCVLLRHILNITLVKYCSIDCMTSSDGYDNFYTVKLSNTEGWEI